MAAPGPSPDNPGRGSPPSPIFGSAPPRDEVGTASFIGDLAVIPEPRDPARIGPYRILQRIGEGGMGVVYLAEQESPVRRRVAIKVIKAGLDSREVIGRFEAERQALALMDHSNVARVFDAGSTPDGRPYFVMEHVAGAPINAYCDDRRLGVVDRLALFTQVCDAIQHAHQKGVIHRDIKPGNILIQVIDGKPAPKVIDFGVAKAISQRLTERTVFTEQGRLIGTPEYMSPEQAEMSGLSVDTRTDIYSLGVVLYELLTGSLPFEKKALREAGFGEIQRIIREVEPARPSTRLSTGGAQTGAAAERRRTDAGALARQVRGDLDWITMKALEKDPTRRYASASEFAADIGRHLRDEPVQAGPPSAGYRVGKFVRRHRVGVVAAALVVLALVAGVVGTTWQAARATRAERDATAQRDEAERERDRARTEAETAKAVSGFLDEMIASADPNIAAGKEVTVREVVDKAAKRIDTSFSAGPLVESSLRTTIGRTYLGLADFEEAQRQFDRALTLTIAAEGEESERALAARAHTGVVFMLSGRSGEAAPILRRVFEAMRRWLGEDHPDTLRVRLNLAWVCWMGGEYDEADTLLTGRGDAWIRAFGPESREGLTWTAHMGLVRLAQGRAAEAEAITGPAIEPAVRVLGEHHQATQHLMDTRAAALYNLDRTAESEALRRRGLEIKTRVFGPDHPDTLRAYNFLAWPLMRQGKLEEAEQVAREGADRARAATGDDSPETLDLLNTLASALGRLRKHQEAEAAYRSALTGLERLRGVDHPVTLDTVYNLGSLLALQWPDQTRVVEGEALLRRAAEARERVLGAEHPSTLLSLDAIASLLRNQARFKEAAEIFARTLAVARRTLGVEHGQTLYALYNLASALSNSGRVAEAEPLAREHWEALKRIRGPEHPDTLMSAVFLAGRLSETDRPDEAESMLREALATLRRTVGAEDGRTAVALCGQAWMVLREGRLDEVEAPANEALAIRRSKGPALASGVPEPLCLLARVLIERGDGAGAEPLMREALETRTRMLAPASWFIPYTRGWLGAAVALQGRFEEAEPMVVGAYESLLAARGEADWFTTRALDDVVAMYEAWGNPEKAEEWRRRKLNERGARGGEGE